MKTGLITFHKVDNIGAVLQATALLSAIRAMGVDCEIIDFRSNKAVERHSLIWKTLRVIKKAIMYRRRERTYQREAKFNAFRKKYYSISRRTYWGDADIEKNPPKYDLLISGSDQILNTTLTGNSRSYYLAFAEQARKVSYGSSFGREIISEEEYRLIKSELPKFRQISVREKSASEIIEKSIGVKPELVLDPVFLLDKEIWLDYSNQKMKLPFEHYIFVYSMETSEILETLVKRLHEETGLPVLVVRGGGKPGRIIGTEDSVCGPSDFLRYIKDADYVITNSFHGIAFSLIFKKKFFCVAHTSRNARLQNILSLINCESSFVHLNDLNKYNDKMIDGFARFSEVYPYVLSSRMFLRKVISE